jgi:hypothetical protein
MIEIDVQNKTIKGKCKAKDFKQEIEMLREELEARK